MQKKKVNVRGLIEKTTDVISMVREISMAFRRYSHIIRSDPSVRSIVDKVMKGR